MFFHGETSQMGSTGNSGGDWQDYVKLFASSSGKANEYVAVPIFPARGFVVGNVVTASAQAVLALAGIGTPEDVQEARAWILAERAKLSAPALPEALSEPDLVAMADMAPGRPLQQQMGKAP
jgi:hypothetical protein